MSCYVCSDKQFQTIGYFVVERGYEQYGWEMHQILTLLYIENVRSWNYRYREDLPEEKMTYCPEQAEKRITPVQFIKLLHNLKYQSCEHPTRDDSPAWRFLKRWEEQARAELPEKFQSRESRNLPGYESAEWGF